MIAPDLPNRERAEKLRSALVEMTAAMEYVSEHAPAALLDLAMWADLDHATTVAIEVLHDDSLAQYRPLPPRLDDVCQEIVRLDMALAKGNVRT
jgi:hypothetical protein